MGRLNTAVRANVRSKGSACSISVVRKRLSAEDIDDLDYLLKDETIPASVIAEQLGLLVEMEITPHTMNRHRRGVLGKPGGCSCRS